MIVYAVKLFYYTLLHEAKISGETKTEKPIFTWPVSRSSNSIINWVIAARQFLIGMVHFFAITKPPMLKPRPLQSTQYKRLVKINVN
jgi:hypothetical protein